MTTLCRTTLQYLEGLGPEGPAVRSVELEIGDARSDPPGTWEECGFELVAHRSAVADWEDDQVVASVNYKEMEAVARDLTGADVALVAGHIRRSPGEARRHEQLAPIPFVHSDFAAGHDRIVRRAYEHPTEGAAEALARNGVTSAEVSGARRILILQFWRNVGPAKMDYPIAFCDCRTLTPAEGRAFHVEDYAGTGASFEALGIVAPADPSAHAWFAFPEMTAGEVVAFRTYDTELVAGGRTYFTPHSAFRDPEVPLGRPARSSVELRANCLFF